MPKISIVDRNAREYQDWLGPETPDHLTPRALSSELVLTHEWQPGHHVLQERLSHYHGQYTSLAASWTVPQQLCPAPPTGRIRWVLAASIWMPAAAAIHNMVIGVSTGAPGTGNLAALVTNYGIQSTPVSIQRPFLLPVGWDMWGMWAAGAAGEVVEFDSIYADYRCCEPLPRL